MYANGFLAVQHIWSSGPRLECQTNCSEILQPLRLANIFKVACMATGHLNTWWFHWWLCNNHHTYNEVRMIWTGICDDCFRVYLKIHYSLSIWQWRLIWSPFKLPLDWFHIKGVFFHLLSVEVGGVDDVSRIQRGCQKQLFNHQRFEMYCLE